MSMFTLPTRRSTITTVEQMSDLTCRRIGAGLMLLSALVTLTAFVYIVSLF